MPLAFAIFTMIAAVGLGLFFCFLLGLLGLFLGSIVVGFLKAPAVPEELKVPVARRIPALRELLDEFIERVRTFIAWFDLRRPKTS